MGQGEGLARRGVKVGKFKRKEIGVLVWLISDRRNFLRSGTLSAHREIIFFNDKGRDKEKIKVVGGIKGGGEVAVGEEK